MTNDENGQVDTQVQPVLDALAKYKDSHPNARIDVHRQNSMSIRVRIIDPEFAGMDRVDREPPIWRLLKTLPEGIFANLTMLLLLTPEEAEASLANLEFENPIPSRVG